MASDDVIPSLTRAGADRPAPPDPAALVRQHQAEVWRYLRYLGATPELADDLTQETFLQLLRAPFQDQGRVSRAAWLRTVARNFFLKTLRRKPMLRIDESADSEPGAAGADPASVAAADAAFAAFVRDDGGQGHLAALRQCLDELDGRGRQAIRMQYEERASRGDIGQRLGLSEDGVKSLMRRLRTALRACVERRIGT